MLRKVIIIILIPIFNTTSLELLYVKPAFAQSVINLPPPGTTVSLTSNFNPPIIKGITIYPNNPLQFDFIINQGDQNLTLQQLRQEGLKMVKYFMASMTIPNKEMWVNLSPLEKSRIIGESLGHTAMGRDLLAEDYMLKQLSASMMDPNSDIGKKFWDKVYKQAREKFGTTDVPVNTFNKVWIVPDKAVVVEAKQSAFVAERHLKVMLEEDYLLLSKYQSQPGDMSRFPGTCPEQLRVSGMRTQAGCQANKALNVKATEGTNGYGANDTNTLASQIIRAIVIPALEKEVNEGSTFATVRQVYNAMILATWYKQNLKETLLAKVYANKNKTRGVDIDDKQFAQRIYEQYLRAYKKGVVNFIREEPLMSSPNVEDPTLAVASVGSSYRTLADARDPEQATVTRKYFSGGVVGVTEIDRAQLSEATPKQIAFIKGQGNAGRDFAMKVNALEVSPQAKPNALQQVQAQAAEVRQESAVDAAMTGNEGSTQERIEKALADLATDPLLEKFKINRTQWIHDQLTQLNQSERVFSDYDLVRLAGALFNAFTSRIGISLVPPEHIKIFGRYFIFEDAGSGDTRHSVSWEDITNYLIANKESDHKKMALVYVVYKNWAEAFRPALGSQEDRQTAINEFNKRIHHKYSGITLTKKSAAVGIMKTVTRLLALLPDHILGSPKIVYRLRGGIDLVASRDQGARIAHYIEATGVLGIQPTVFDLTDFIQTFLHEFGHVVQGLYMDTPEFETLLRNLSGERYALPALGSSAEGRKNYIGSKNEFFAETFMHYILHGEYFSQGFPGVVQNPENWKKVYAFYRDHVFKGVEYRVINGKLQATIDKAQLVPLNRGIPNSPVWVDAAMNGDVDKDMQTDWHKKFYTALGTGNVDEAKRILVAEESRWSVSPADVIKAKIFITSPIFRDWPARAILALANDNINELELILDGVSLAKNDFPDKLQFRIFQTMLSFRKIINTLMEIDGLLSAGDFSRATMLIANIEGELTSYNHYLPLLGPSASKFYSLRDRLLELLTKMQDDIQKRKARIDDRAMLNAIDSDIHTIAQEIRRQRLDAAMVNPTTAMRPEDTIEAQARQFLSPLSEQDQYILAAWSDENVVYPIQQIGLSVAGERAERLLKDLNRFIGKLGEAGPAVKKRIIELAIATARPLREAGLINDKQPKPDAAMTIDKGDVGKFVSNVLRNKKTEVELVGKIVEVKTDPQYGLAVTIELAKTHKRITLMGAAIENLSFVPAYEYFLFDLPPQKKQQLVGPFVITQGIINDAITFMKAGAGGGHFNYESFVQKSTSQLTATTKDTAAIRALLDKGIGHSGIGEIKVSKLLDALRSFFRVRVSELTGLASRTNMEDFKLSWFQEMINSINQVLPVDAAMKANKDAAVLVHETRYGGINLTPELLDLQIKRDKNGIALPMAQQPLAAMKIDGFIPIIISLKPINLSSMLTNN